MDREMLTLGKKEEDWEPEYPIERECGEDEELLNAGPHQMEPHRRSFLYYLFLPGILWAFTAAVGLAAHMILVEYLSDVVHPIQALFIRTSFLLIFAIFISWDQSIDYDANDLFANFLYGVLDNLGMGAGYLAVAYLSAADATAILLNKPVPAAIMARAFLGEPFDLLDGGLAVINGIGLVVIAETEATSPSESTAGSPVLGVVLALFGLFCLSGMYNTTRWLSIRQREDPSLLCFMSGFVGLSLSSIYLTSTHSWGFPDTTNGIILSVLLGLVTMFELYAGAAALRTVNVLIVTAVKTLSIPIAYIYAITVTGELAVWQTLIGVGITLVTSFLISFKPHFLPRGDG